MQEGSALYTLISSSATSLLMEMLIRIIELGSQMCSNFSPHVRVALLLVCHPYHDDDAIYLFHVPNCQFILLFLLNALN